MQHVKRPTTVPHVARWSDEETPLWSALAAAGGRLVYRDEAPGDRDARGVLWGRVGHAPGQGRPHYSEMHPARQRAAMLGRLCQVCAGPASRTRAGWLFLAHQEDDTPPGWPDGFLSVQPPLCLPCAGQAVRECPSLAGRALALRVRKPVPFGVYGNVYLPGPAELEEVGAGHTLRYGDPATRWMVASQLVMELRRCTVVDLTAELAA